MRALGLGVERNRARRSIREVCVVGRGAARRTWDARGRPCSADAPAMLGAEQVADAADVSAGGVDLLEDSVAAERLRVHAGLLPRESVAWRVEPRRGALRDEQVRIGGARPPGGAMIEPSRETHFIGLCERDAAAVRKAEAAIDDVGELDRAGRPVSECAERDDSDAERGRGVGMIQRGADRGRVERHRDRLPDTHARQLQGSFQLLSEPVSSREAQTRTTADRATASHACAATWTASHGEPSGGV